MRDTVFAPDAGASPALQEFLSAAFSEGVWSFGSLEAFFDRLEAGSEAA